jgi:hypothetical protein
MSTTQVTYNHGFIVTKNTHFPAVSLRVQSCNVRKLAKKRNMLGKRSNLHFRLDPVFPSLWDMRHYELNLWVFFFPSGAGTTRFTPCTERGEDRLGAGEALLGCPT